MRSFFSMRSVTSTWLCHAACLRLRLGSLARVPRIRVLRRGDHGDEEEDGEQQKHDVHRRKHAVEHQEPAAVDASGHITARTAQPALGRPVSYELVDEKAPAAGAVCYEPVGGWSAFRVL